MPQLLSNLPPRNENDSKLFRRTKCKDDRDNKRELTLLELLYGRSQKVKFWLTEDHSLWALRYQRHGLSFFPEINWRAVTNFTMKIEGRETNLYGGISGT